MSVWTYQHSQISLTGSTDHVWYKALMPRCIQQCEVFIGSVKCCSSNFYCFALKNTNYWENTQWFSSIWSTLTFVKQRFILRLFIVLPSAFCSQLCVQCTIPYLFLLGLCLMPMIDTYRQKGILLLPECINHAWLMWITIITERSNWEYNWASFPTNWLDHIYIPVVWVRQMKLREFKTTFQL